METRSVLEGRQPQGVNEAIRWLIDTTPAPVAAGAVIVTDETDGGADVTASVAPGTASVLSGKLALPLIGGLTAGHIYRAAAQYSDGTSTIEVYIEIEAER